jgi:type VI secretion system protein VasG
MIIKDVRLLMNRMNVHMTVALEAAAGYSISKTHYEVFPDHLIIKLIETGTGDIPLILNHFNINPDEACDRLQRKIDRFGAGNTAGPRFSREILDLMESSWLISSLHLNQNKIRSGALIELFIDDFRYSNTPFGDVVSSIEAKSLRHGFADIVSASIENELSTQDKSGAVLSDGSTTAQNALDKFTINITGRAKKGEIDPVYGRDSEIFQVIDVLSRRRKNNPILVGEAGVGKTAIVEGLAVRIASGQIIQSLANAEIRNLDLAMLQAGAGVRGEFENRLKSVINEVVNSPNKIILFIDEAHTLIGAGGSGGGGDAANLLKPALARGALRTIAATTWSEYKKYIEKDPALERRFQMIKVDEPNEENCAIILRGIKNIYEKHHDLTVTDDAVKAAVSLSKRYIAGRQLPDKAVDVLDTACARVKMARSEKPAHLELLERKLEYVQRRLAGLKRDKLEGICENESEIEETLSEIDGLKENIKKLESERIEQSKLIEEITLLKAELHSQQNLDGPPSEYADDRIARLLELRGRLRDLQKERQLVLSEVDGNVVASVIADWTGIPVGRMIKDQAAALLEYDVILGKNIIGQEHALREIGNCLRVTKSGMGKQDNPIGVFLLIGPSGVGKTETARYTADILFGGEKSLTTINMSEYQEKHTVSQLKGSPPGYVGYGEGGVLTEAVRRRPYSVVLLDEIEKADREVLNLFYQVFDKGFMRDGEGREIDFKNTVIIMTSNLCSEEMIEALRANEKLMPDQLIESIRPMLIKYFQAAFLARVKIIPFYPLDLAAIKNIARLKLDMLTNRLKIAHKIVAEYSPDIIDFIAVRCNLVETGARNIDYIIEQTILPDVSRELVMLLSEGKLVRHLNIYLDTDSSIKFNIK